MGETEQNIREFIARLRELGMNFQTNEGIIQQKAALAFVEKVTEVTPVDTGDAISNWQVFLGEPELTVRKAFSPGSEGSTRRENVEATIEDAKDRMREHFPGQTIIVGNYLDYIGYRDDSKGLNDGYSPQQPDPGWIENVVEDVRQLVSESVGVDIFSPNGFEKGLPALPDQDLLSDVPF